MRKPRLTFRRAQILYAFLVIMISNSATGVAAYLLREASVIPSTTAWRIAVSACLFVFSLVAGTVAASVLSKAYMKPIVDLTHAAERIAQGDFSARVEVVGADEIHTLLSTFNYAAAWLEGSQEYRNDFINSFTHEFKTPIVSIQGFARQLEREDISPEQRREYAAIIVEETQRLTRLASNILRLSSLESNDVDIRRQPFRLDEQLRRCILLLEKEWSDKELALDVDLEEITFAGDSDLLSEVWVNLLGNAIKFTPRGGSIAVRLRGGADAVAVTIRDTGIGMDQQTLDHMFEKFFQGAHSHSFDGNGLGLALVKTIVERSGGTVSADSRVGEGTTFTVTLKA